MAETTIEWADYTFNPWMGCTKVSPACKNCYAERDFDHRYGKVKWGPSGTRVKTSHANWQKPLAWNRQAVAEGTRPRVFCASLADVFEDWQGPILSHDGVILGRDGRASIGSNRMTLDNLREHLFGLIDATPHLDWLLLTKRPENVARMWPLVAFPDAGVPGTLGRRLHLANVWLGTSIESQEWTDKRLPHLHAAKRHGLVSTTFVSAEPLVGDVILQGHRDGKVYNHLGEGGIDWVITGGESGPGARPAHPDWYRSLRAQCEIAGVPFLFKQWGEWVPKSQGFNAIGRRHNEWGVIHRDGSFFVSTSPWNGRDDDGSGEATVIRVGKKAAGRLLDGVTHDGFPPSPPAPLPKGEGSRSSAEAAGSTGPNE